MVNQFQHNHIALSKAEKNVIRGMYCITTGNVDKFIPLNTIEAIRRQYIRLFRARQTLIRAGVPVNPMSVKELPDDPVERCGYFWLSTDKLFGLFGKKDPFLPACSLHDSLYDELLRGDITRKEADKIFYDAMKTLVK